MSGLAMVKRKVTRFKRRFLGDDAKEWARLARMLKGVRVVDLATCDDEGPHVRPVTMVEAGGVHYVLTGTSDAKVRQLRHDTRYEAHLPWKRGKDTGYIRFRGRVMLIEDRAEKRAAADAAGFLEHYWEGFDDPNLTVIRLGIEAAELMPPGKAEWTHLTRGGKGVPGGKASRRRRPGVG